MRRLIEGGAYSGAALIYFSAPCAVLNRGWRLFTFPLHVRRLIEGGAYLGAALNRGWRFFGGGAYLLFRSMCGA